MRYGAMNFPVKPVLQELKEIEALGFDYVELAMDPPQSHHSLLKQQRKELLNALQESRMEVICHLPTFVSIADLTESIRIASLKEVLDSLQVAAEFSPLKVVLHPPYLTGLGMFVYDQAKNYGMESLSAIVRKAEDLGLMLCIENMFAKTHMLVEPDDFEEIFKHFPSLKLTLDTGHANIKNGSGKRIFELISRFSDQLGHVHVSDNFGKEDNHLPIGTGTVDFSRVAGSLKNIGYDDTVTFEIFSRDRNYLRISRQRFASMLELRVKTQPRN
ncbi:MAG: sugar phosphate isomerase/epimerase family protein [Desulfomonilaceae bacterium]